MLNPLLQGHPVFISHLHWSKFGTLDRGFWIKSPPPDQFNKMIEQSDTTNPQSKIAP